MSAFILPTIHYVLGFAFSPDMHKVLMINKLRPQWQAGKMNGIGGKTEPSDPTVFYAMCREFAEETGVKTTPEAWTKVARISREVGPSQFSCYVFKCRLGSNVWVDARTMEDEEIERVAVWDVLVDPSRYIPNIPHLIGLCLDPDLQGVQQIYYRD